MDPQSPNERFRVVSDEELAEEPIVLLDEPVQTLPVKVRPSHEGKSLEPDVAQILEPVVVTHADPEHSWEKHRLGLMTPWAWFVLIAVLCLCAGGWGLWSTWKDMSAEQMTPSVPQVSEAEKNRQAAQLISLLESRLKGYITARNITEILPHVRDPEHVKQLMMAHADRYPVRAAEYRKLEVLDTLTLGSHAFWVAGVSTEQGRKMLLLEQMDSGDVRVDWENAVGFQPVLWDDFLQGKHAGAYEMRVRVTLDDYFAYEYADSERFRCYRLEGYGGNKIGYGYVTKEAKIDHLLQMWLNLQGGRPISMILTLKRPEGTQAPNACEIVGVNAPRWVKVESGESPEEDALIQQSGNGYEAGIR